jgi:hypothetical protein
LLKLVFRLKLIDNIPMFGRKGRERVAIYKPADCLGSSCEFYTGKDCDARLELLNATGKSGETDKGPYVDDCSYALYGKVCMGGDEQVVVGLSSSSPNGKASLAEMVGRSGLYEDQRIVLNTPPEEIKF